MTPIFSPIHIPAVTTDMLVRAAYFFSFEDGLGRTIFGWERCRTWNTFSKAAFWNIRWNFMGVELNL